MQVFLSLKNIQSFLSPIETCCSLLRPGYLVVKQYLVYVNHYIKQISFTKDIHFPIQQNHFLLISATIFRNNSKHHLTLHSHTFCNNLSFIADNYAIIFVRISKMRMESRKPSWPEVFWCGWLLSLWPRQWWQEREGLYTYLGNYAHLHGFLTAKLARFSINCINTVNFQLVLARFTT